MDNKKISTCIGAVVLVVIAVTVGVFVWVYERGQGWDTDIAVIQMRVVPKEGVKEDGSHTELDKEVSFCGKVYKTNGAMLGNIDIVQKVAEIATKNNSQHICENITSGDLKRETLLTKLIQASPNQADYNPLMYYLQIGDSNFKIDVSSKRIYVLGGFDGEPAYIGVY